MEYEAFLNHLASLGWSVQGKSFATADFGPWQVSFIRMGGRFQRPGMVAFVLCVRHQCLRDVDKAIPRDSKNPYDYPFKLTLSDIQAGHMSYQSRLLNFELADFPMTSDWEHVYSQIERACRFFSDQTGCWLQGELSQLASPGYIEQIWLEDLAGLSDA